MLIAYNINIYIQSSNFQLTVSHKLICQLFKLVKKYIIVIVH